MRSKATLHDAPPAVESGWREATHEEFFKAIGPSDCHPRIVGDWPYTSSFETSGKIVRGKIVEFLLKTEGLPRKQYLLPDR